MATNLLEQFKGRLAISEKYFAQENGGNRMSQQAKFTTAVCLNNVSKYLNEAFTSASGTQRSDMGVWKRFCLDITTLTTPNLIAGDIFMTKPMTAINGSLVYLKLGLGNEKGGVGGRDAQGHIKTVTNSIYGYGQMTEERAAYTSSAVVEAITSTSAAMALAWGPVVKGVFANGSAGNFDVKIIAADGTVTYANLDNDGKVPAASLVANGKVAYKYDNEVVPAAKLPTLVGEMAEIPLRARARRIAVYWSQLAAYEAKNDYGINFESTIIDQAKAELETEVDGEAVMLVRDAADEEATAGRIGNFHWTDEQLDTISYSMKAEGFSRVLESAKMDVYKRTQKYVPNWMLVSPGIVPILTFVPGFKAATSNVGNGAYIAGTINGVKVIVSPILTDFTSDTEVCYLGFLGSDGKTATGCYAPYMQLVPTQLLGFADGGMEQGFSSMYDMIILNKQLLSKITVTKGNGAASVYVTSEGDMI